MSKNQARQAVLKELYEGYLENPGTIFDVSKTIKEYGYDPIKFGDYLIDRGLIKNQRYYPGGILEAQISNAGIIEIEPNYFNDLSDHVVAVLAETNQNGIMEILQWKPNQFIRAFDLAKYLENSMLVEATYLSNEVHLELTNQGRDYFNRSKSSFM